MVIYDERLIDLLFSLCSSLCSFQCVSLLHLALLIPLLLVLCPNAKANITCRSAFRGVLFSGRIHSSLTTSTTRRLLTSSSRRNPATKTWCRRTCVMPNSTMRPSGKRSLHHCSFRSEKNQRTEDKLISLMKKVCCQLSLFSPTQERGDPCMNLVR